MKKRIVFTVLICIALCGCGKSEQYSEEEYNLMAEYVAGILIDHAYINEDRFAYKRDDIIVNPIVEKPTEKNTEPETNYNEQGSGVKEQTSEVTTSESNDKVDVSGLLQFDGIETTYLGAILCETYPPDGFIYVQADEEYLVLEFVLKNNTSEDVLVTLNNGFYLNVGDKQYHNFTSGLINEVSSLKSKKIEANSEYKTVLIFHIDSNTATNNMKITTSSSTDKRFAIIDSFERK